MRKSIVLLFYQVLLLNLFVLFMVPVSYAQAPTLPGQPLLLYPPDGATMKFPGTNVKLPFAWSEVSSATTYEINVVVGTRPAAQVITSATMIELNLELSVRESRETVKWSVRAFSAFGSSPPSKISTFTFGENTGTPFPGITPLPTPLPKPTPTPLPPPALLSPEDGEVFSEISGLMGIEFEWETVSSAEQYQFTIYKNNVPYIRRVVQTPSARQSFTEQIHQIYQWDVQSINQFGSVGLPGIRYSFTIGQGIYPTPTPQPLSIDFNRNGRFDAQDLYLFATRFRTNDSQADYNHNGLNDIDDVLKFVEMYRMNSQ